MLNECLIHILLTMFFLNIMKMHRNYIYIYTGNSEFRLTHWKQDLLMLDEPVAVCTGDEISGSIQMTRNPKWRRHMTITLDFNITAKDKEDHVREFHCPEQKFLPLLLI